MTRNLAKGRVLVRDLRLIERDLHVEYGLFCRLEHRIQAAQHGHWQDHIAVLAADIEVAEHVVGNAPDEISDPVELTLFHAAPGLWGGLTMATGHEDART